jgi:hypothetical protein
MLALCHRKLRLLRLRQTIYTAGLIRDYLRAPVRRLAELAIGLALVALLGLVILLRLVIRIPDMDGIDE